MKLNIINELAQLKEKGFILSFSVSEPWKTFELYQKITKLVGF